MKIICEGCDGNCDGCVPEYKVLTEYYEIDYTKINIDNIENVSEEDEDTLLEENDVITDDRAVVHYEIRSGCGDIDEFEDFDEFTETITAFENGEGLLECIGDCKVIEE